MRPSVVCGLRENGPQSVRTCRSCPAREKNFLIVAFLSKSVQQAAALPFVLVRGNIEILLITSRRRGRWVLPKGWPDGQRGLHEAARREAKQEAGVVGTVADTTIGTYRYAKRMRQGYQVQCQVFVYPLLVMQHLVKWKEKPMRRLEWLDLDTAAARADDAELADLFARVANDKGAALLQFADTVCACASAQYETIPIAC